jgi:malonyl-CoA/methylmalonyl-CoA synthetase
MSLLSSLFAPHGPSEVPALEVGVSGGPARTFGRAEIEERARRTARTLADRGVQAGDRLAVLLPNRLEFIDLFLGCLIRGAILVPMNTLYRAREIAHIVADAAPVAVVTTPDGAALVGDGAPVWDVKELAAASSRSGPADAGAAVDDSTPALLVYTSGTTGRPKGAVLTHGNLAANARNLVSAWGITAADRYLGVLPLFHVHGLGNGVGSWLVSGCRMRLEERLELEKASALFEEFRPTLFFGVPALYSRLLELPVEVARRIGSRARLFVSGSAPRPPRVFEAFRERFGHAILERYGMTETLMTLGNPYEGERRPGTVGRPFPGVETRLVDPQGDDVGDGETGELLVRGPTVFAGYWRRPDATAEAFVDGWFRTGDLAERSSDGHFTLRGRARELIIVKGFNVYPREIEEVLLEQPGVREAAVIGVSDERRGEVPVAFFVGDVDPADLEAGCRRNLASFKVPTQFIRREALPRNALGKVQKHRLVAGPQG